MIIPTMAATIAHIRTEPAAISFTSPAIGLRSGDTRLTNLSIAVLNPSAASTTPKQSMIAIHSFRVMPKQNPATCYYNNCRAMYPGIMFFAYKTSDTFPGISEAPYSFSGAEFFHS